MKGHNSVRWYVLLRSLTIPVPSDRIDREDIEQMIRYDWLRAVTFLFDR